MKIREYIGSFTDRELAEGYAYVYGNISDIRSGNLRIDEAEKEIAKVRKTAENDDSGIWEWYLEGETEKTCVHSACLSEEAENALRKQDARYAAALLVQFCRISKSVIPLTGEEKERVPAQPLLLPCLK